MRAGDVAFAECSGPPHVQQKRAALQVAVNFLGRQRLEQWQAAEHARPGPVEGPHVFVVDRVRRQAAEGALDKFIFGLGLGQRVVQALAANGGDAV